MIKSVFVLFICSVNDTWFDNKKVNVFLGCLSDYYYRNTMAYFSINAKIFTIHTY